MIKDNEYYTERFANNLKNGSLYFDNNSFLSLFYFIVDRGQKGFYPAYLDRFNIVPSVKSEKSLYFNGVSDYIEHHIHITGNVEIITDNVLLDIMDRKAFNETKADDDLENALIKTRSYRVYLLDASKDCRENYQSELANPDEALKLIHTALVFARTISDNNSFNIMNTISCLWPCSFSANTYDQLISRNHLPVIPTTVKRILKLAKGMKIDFNGQYLISSPGLKRMLFSYQDQNYSKTSNVWAAKLGILNPNKTLDEIKQIKYQEMLKSLGLSIKKTNN